MKAIILSEKEIEVINKQLNGEIEVYDVTEEDQIILTGVIEKAENLLEELDAYDEFGDDLIKWFYGKYKEQEV
ncbi:MAG: hypothetical protein J6Q61_09610 [Bacteroidales bacterium]|nr:hypothetical protein [Bacteroidales bacterium]